MLTSCDYMFTCLNNEAILKGLLLKKECVPIGVVSPLLELTSVG